MNDLCEALACPRCETVLAEPISRNPLSRVDGETRICANCGLGEALLEYDGVKIPALDQRLER